MTFPIKSAEIEFRGVKLQVEYVHYPYYPSQYEGGVAITPPEPACVEIREIKLGEFDVYGLLEDHIDDITELTLEAANGDV